MVPTPLAPGAPATFNGGALMFSAGVLGMTNSMLQMINAASADDDRIPGVLESSFGFMLGDGGRAAGRTADLFIGIRPGAVVLHGPQSLRETYDAFNTLNTMKNEFEGHR